MVDQINEIFKHSYRIAQSYLELLQEQLPIRLSYKAPLAVSYGAVCSRCPNQPNSLFPCSAPNVLWYFSAYDSMDSPQRNKTLGIASALQPNPSQIPRNPPGKLETYAFAK